MKRIHKDHGTNITVLACMVLMLVSGVTHGQADTTAAKPPTKFDQFNKKMEHLFKILPAPIISYSPEAGNIFGLAKNNIIELSKKDTISKPSKLSEVITFSTKVPQHSWYDFGFS
ncbi:MAG: hypothetical protein EOO04_36010 [Chitinophagaceae bacterium]|nr:MAG: hypothetical protein EOO04_36010 [Chitinophagaceae bacterium]